MRQEAKGQPLTRREELNLEKMYATAQKVIDAVNAGKLKLKRSCVVDDKLYLYRNKLVYRFTVIDPINRVMGIAKDTEGRGFSEGLETTQITRLINRMKGWLANSQ
jgi:hypothetical protein